MLQEIALTPMKNTPLTALSHHIQNQFATWKLAVSLTFLPNSIDVVLYTCTMRFAVWFFLTGVKIFGLYFYKLNI
jgi:hypothetical protein